MAASSTAVSAAAFAAALCAAARIVSADFYPGGAFLACSPKILPPCGCGGRTHRIAPQRRRQVLLSGSPGLPVGLRLGRIRRLLSMPLPFLCLPSLPATRTERGGRRLSLCVLAPLHLVRLPKTAFERRFHWKKIVHPGY